MAPRMTTKLWSKLVLLLLLVLVAISSRSTTFAKEDDDGVTTNINDDLTTATFYTMIVEDEDEDEDDSIMSEEDVTNDLLMKMPVDEVINVEEEDSSETITITTTSHMIVEDDSIMSEEDVTNEAVTTTTTTTTTLLMKMPVDEIVNREEDDSSETTSTTTTTTTTMDDLADLVPSGVPKERIASETDLLIPVGVPKVRRGRGVRNLQKNGGGGGGKNGGGGGGGGGDCSGCGREYTPTGVVGYGAGTVRDPSQPKYMPPKDNSQTTVWTKMNGGDGVPDGVSSTTGDNTGNYVTNRGYTTPGIPILQDNGCTGTDQLVRDYGNYQHTISKCGIVEKNDCTNPFDVSVDTKNDYRSNSACMLGTCGGCCRDYKYLECDIDGTLLNPFVPCICSERTYGGNPFTRATAAATQTQGQGQQSAPVPRPTGPVAAPVVRPTSPRNVVQTSQCKANRNQRPWWGKNLGDKPNTEPDNFPQGFRLGECTYSHHCDGTRGRCCMPDFCLCGSGPDCLA